MINKPKGEVTLSSGHILVMDYNALAHYEELSGKSAIEVVEKFANQTAKLGDIRYLTMAMLMRHHPDIDINEAGDIAFNYADEINAAFEIAVAPSDNVGNDQRKPVARRSTKKVAG